MHKSQAYRYLLATVSLILYIAVAYDTARHETIRLLCCYVALFLFYLLMVARPDTINKGELNILLAISVIFRVALLFSLPNLSDDFYRFIWDGRLLAAGYHPFAEVPAFYLAQPQTIAGIDAALYNNLNATETFTIYPPVAQLIFWLSVKLSPDTVHGSVIVMKSVIFVFEVATLWLLIKLLDQFGRPRHHVLIYALNPLVILELTGNLHFEGIMVCFLLLGILLLTRRQPLLTSAAFALSICTKLIPLMFLPLWAGYLGWKKSFLYWSATLAFTIVLFLPLLNKEIIDGLSASLGYYFQRFEFNASIYYLVREVGFMLAGFNIIQYAGPCLALTATLVIFYISFRNVNTSETPTLAVDSLFVQKMMWVLFVYFLSVTILHPWYITTLLAISVLTPYRFPAVWTGLIFLTYAGYTETGFKENLPLVALEYILLLAYLFYETLWTKHRDHSLLFSTEIQKSGK